MKKVILGLALALAALATSASADDYVFRDGYYWQGGRAFSLVTQPGYWANSCYGNYYVAGKSYYKEVAVAPAAYTSAADPGWRSKLADVVKSREEQRQYLEALRAVGHEDAAAGYGFSYKFGNASTQYGVGPLVQDKGADVDRLFQAMAQLTQNAQKLGGEATAGFQGVVQAYGDQRNRVAETLAKVEALKALQDAPVNEIRGFGLKAQASGTAPAGVDPPARGTGGRAAAFDALVRGKCAKCHAGANAGGGVVMASANDYDSLDEESKLGVLQRLILKDDGKRMPLKAPPLTAEEYDLFKSH
jgi:hypothetical protein